MATSGAPLAPSSSSQSRARSAWALGLGLAVASSSAIVLATGWTAPAPSSLTTLTASWTTAVSASSSRMMSSRSHPVVGDEGFWLSRNDLIGSTASELHLGDRITIAAGSGNARVAQVFEVIELKPLTEAQPQLSKASNTATLLTMVVCREVDGSITPPRMLRFLIEGATASQNGPVQSANPRTL